MTGGGYWPVLNTVIGDVISCQVCNTLTGDVISCQVCMPHSKQLGAGNSETFQPEDH